MWTRSLLLAGLMTVAVACKHEETPTPPPATPVEPQVDSNTPATLSAPESKQNVTLSDVTDTATAYASQTTDQVVEASKQKLDAMKTKFAELKAAAAAKGEQAQAKFDQMKADFDAKIDAAQKQLDEFKDANAEHMDQIKQDLSGAVSEAGAILQDAWSRFKGEDKSETPAESPQP